MDYRHILPASACPLQLATHAGLCQVNGLVSRGTLLSDRALTLRADQAGALCVDQGRVWITFAHAAQDCAVRGGDYFLSQGERLCMAPGQVLVMESFTAAVAASACFSWAPAGIPRCAGPLARDLHDLRAALGLAMAAAGRLLRGLTVGWLGGVRV